MNERIRELVRQADACYIPRYDMWQMDTETLEKFAELIVRECADVLLKWKGEPFPFDEDLAASLIKEHFGVK
jgi:ABC-type taurine transport system substrate-binding protein